MAKRSLTSALRLEPPDLPYLVVKRELMTDEQVLACRRILRDIFERFGLTYTLGQIIFERLFTSTPDLRPKILAKGGIAQLLGRDIPIDFWKFPADAHDRYVDRLKKDGLIQPEQYQECFKIQYELSKFGILKQIGEVLVDKGYADRALAQEYLRPPADPERLPCLAFDRIAVYNGFISEGASSAARAKQEKVLSETGLSVPIGRILYETGQLRRVEVEAILAAQVRIGRLTIEEADLRILKLSRIEEQALAFRLQKDGTVDGADIRRSEEIAEKLQSFGLDFAMIEVLWLQDKVPANLIRDVVAHQTEHLARLEPKLPEVYLSLAPSAPLLLQQRPPDIPEVDFLFGQCARIAGAVDRSELENAMWIFRRCRTELGLAFSLGQILFDLHEHDPVRFDRLRAALAELQDLLGYAYEVRSLRLSPLEYEVVAERLGSADAALETAIQQSNEIVAALAEMGLEKDVTEILLHKGLLTDSAIGDLLVEREARDRRLLGGWRESATSEESKIERMFEQAFSTDGAATGWVGNLLGNLAIAEGLIDPPQLVQALYTQIRAREIGFAKPIGEILVELGHLNVDQVQSLLRLQANKHEEPETTRMARRKRVEAEFPETLTGDDQVLYTKLMQAGVLDEEGLRKHLESRAALKALGLKGALREVVLARGEVDREIVEGIFREVEIREVEAEKKRKTAEFQGPPSDEQIREAYSEALSQAQSVPIEAATVSERVLQAAPPPRRWRARIAFAGLVAGLAFVTFGPLAGFLLGDLVDPRVAPPVLSSPGTTVQERAPADDRQFAAAMEARGLVHRDGTWVRPEDAPPPSREDANYVRTRREELATSLAAAGFKEVEGGWVHPEAIERLTEERAKSAGGEVKEGGAWRSAKAVYTPAAVAEGPPDEHSARASPLIKSLEAALGVETQGTRIALRFDTGLPVGARLTVTISRLERPDSPFYSTIVRPDRSGVVGVYARPFGRPLEPGIYLVGLDYRPEFQSREVAQTVARAESRRVEVMIGTPEETALVQTERKRELETVRARIAAMLEEFASEPKVDRRARIAGALLPEAESFWQGLRTWGTGADDALAPTRDALFRAARLLTEAFGAVSTGQPFDDARLEEVRESLATAAELLAPAK